MINKFLCFGLLRYVSARPQTGGHPKNIATVHLAVEGARGGAVEGIIWGCIFCVYFCWRAPRDFLEGVRVFFEGEGVVQRISCNYDK